MNTKNEEVMRGEFESTMTGYKTQRDADGCYIAPHVEAEWQKIKPVENAVNDKGASNARSKAEQ